MQELGEKDKKRLIEEAREARVNAFTPYGHSKTGAAVLGKSGEIYRGCNVSSVISGMGTCAERNAITNAACQGEYVFRAICVYSEKEGEFRPCGMCLQLMNEFAQLSEENDMEIVVVTADGTEEMSLRELIPDLYGPAHRDADLEPYR